MAGEARVDIVSGPNGAGKTSFIRQLMRYALNRDEVIVCNGSLRMDWFDEQSPRYRPRRVILETQGDSGFSEALDRANSGNAKRLFCIGARVAVLDARHFSLNMREAARIGEASHVFLNRTGGLDYTVQAQMLKAIWKINPSANILVEPLDGLNLWNLLDNIPFDL